MASDKSRTSHRCGGPRRSNVLTILIPGLKLPIDIQFLDGKLPVCQRCKKSFKTRELCRIRGGHTSIPWNTTYLCVSFDDTCLTLNRMGEVCLVDEELMHRRFTARMLDMPPLPLHIKKIHKDDAVRSPICTPCKEKSYAKHYCRETQQHLQLPWVTIYIMLSAVPHYEPIDRILSQTSEYGISLSDWNKNKSPVNIIKGNKLVGKDCIDDIQKVQKSRSCLLTINSSSSTLHWLETDVTPQTKYISIRSFTGIPSAIMNQGYDDSNPSMSVVNGAYSSRNPESGYGSEFGQQYHPHYPYYPNLSQSTEYRAHGHPMHSRGPPETPAFCDYPPDCFNSMHQNQQVEYSMRQPYISGHGPQQTIPESYSAISQEIRDSDIYNRGTNYSNAPFSQAQMSTSHYQNEQYSRNVDQQESIGAPLPHTLMDYSKYEGSHQGPMCSMAESHIHRPLPIMSHLVQTDHLDGDTSKHYSDRNEEHIPQREL